MILHPAAEAQPIAAGGRRLLVRDEDVVERRRQDLSFEDDLQAGDRMR